VVSLSIIERVVSILDEKKISQKEICDLLNINSSTFSTWKRRYANIPSDKIVPIADFLKVSIRFLLTGEGTKEKREITEQENEILRIYNALSLKDKTALLTRAYDLEEQNK